ncbi:MAG: DNA/RNA helicase, partial [Lachnospiraceae bacterium]
IEFTNCFRLSGELAEMLGRVWQKEIKGVNRNCMVDSMTPQEVESFLSECEPKNVLCLGARTGKMTEVLNSLEESCPDKYNKKTVFASIRNSDGGATEPNTKTAIFTTFDSSKGLERPVCVIFDWTYDYWYMRLTKPGQAYKILLNIFCVAASRGKERIIFVTDDAHPLITEEELTEPIDQIAFNSDMSIYEMFDFKYKEDIETAFRQIDVEEMRIDGDDLATIEIKDSDELIDLTPCISIYQKTYFKKFNIDRQIEDFFLTKDKDLKFLFDKHVRRSSIEEKVLFLVSLQTKHSRYRTQVDVPFIQPHEKEALTKRFTSMMSLDEDIQIECRIPFYDADGKHVFDAVGLSDVVKDDVYYGLAYLEELSHHHFLICACFMLSLGLKKSYLWNVKNNRIFMVTVPDEQKLLDAVAVAITKGKLEKYYHPKEK